MINIDKFYLEYINKFSPTTLIVRNNIAVMLSEINIRLLMFNKPVLLQQIAYICATAHHETGANYGTWKEVRQEKTDTSRRKEVRRLQDRYWDSGYYGRGPVQLTWQENYKWAQALTGAPLLSQPDLLLTNLSLGYEVMIIGMVAGNFTGKSLNTYINKNEIDYIGARRIINGADRAEDIAKYTEKFYNVLINSFD